MKTIRIVDGLLGTIFRAFGRSFLVLTTLVFVGSFPVSCQTNDVQAQLNSAYKDKILLLRNFYTGSNLAYDQSGALQGAANSGPWTLAGVEIKGIGITAQGIEIVGSRMGTLYKDGKPRAIKVSKLMIQVSKPTSNTETKAAIDLILAKVFIDPAEDLRPMLPEFWRYYLSGTDSQSRSAAWQAILAKAPVVPLRPKDFPAGKLTAPHAVYSPDPQFNKEASSRHIDGVSVLSAVIDPLGTPGEIAIMRPLGMGLDEQAVSMLKQWNFKPGTLNGQPVPTEVNIEVSFRSNP
jgi:TonB family protein